MVATWDDLDDYDESGVEVFRERTSVMLAGSKAAAVAAAVALYAGLTRRRVGIRPDDVVVDMPINKPFLAMWHALKMGRPWDEAVASGRGAADAFGSNWVTSTVRQTAQEFTTTADVRPSWWERETNDDACEWCQTVAMQHYLSAETADFGHDRCFCTPVPVFG